MISPFRNSATPAPAPHTGNPPSPRRHDWLPRIGVADSARAHRFEYVRLLFAIGGRRLFRYNPGMEESLERRFDVAMHELYARIVRECGGKYRPTRFHGMLESQGGLETARTLLRPEADFFAYGFEKLCTMKKPDLTMEAMILDLDYAGGLFTQAELQTARERLKSRRADVRALTASFFHSTFTHLRGGLRRITSGFIG